MIDLKILEQVANDGLKILKKEDGLIEGVVYASANERIIGRIVYATHLPSAGLEEPKSDMDYGVSVELWFDLPAGRQGKEGRRLIGMGHEPNDLTDDGIKRAIEKAKRNAVEDTDFSGFLKAKEILRQAQDDKDEDSGPASPAGRQAGMTRKIRNDMAKREESELIVKLGWETIEGAVEVMSEYVKKKGIDLGELGFILNGDNFIVKERMALATTTGIVDSDESSVILSFITAMLEKENAKGASWGAEVLPDFGKGAEVGFSAYEYGKRAALSAINGVGGKRVKSGKYKVVFGHQAVTELFGSLYVPHVNLGMVELGASLLSGKYGQQVASSLLTIYDDATLPGGAGSKRVTCEGYPAGKTLLIDAGKLVGYLTDSRTRNKILGKREHGKQVLGVDPHDIRQAIDPRNGFRFGRGGGRVAASGVGIYATNLVTDSPKPVLPDKLLESVGDGLFIGRLWYTYPVGGYSSGIITGTAIAECYTIKDGKLGDPILPNTLRIEDNIGEMAKNIIGVGNNQVPTILWASDEITHAPWVAIDNVQFHAINEG